MFANFSLDELKEVIQGCVAEAIKKDVEAPQESSDLIKTKEACELLKITKPTLYSWMEQKFINGYYLGSRLFFKKSELLNSITSKDISVQRGGRYV